jgi:uncharacterized membrane protein (DUF4010 family)
MNFLNINELWLHFAVALGIGLVIGTERERNSKATESNTTAGVRTFAIAALLGATSFFVSLWLHIAVMVCVMVFITFNYFLSQRNDPGLTTEISLIFTVILGGLAINNPSLAASLAVITALLLLVKKRLHNFVLRAITKAEMNEFLLLAAATLIILPIVPNAFMGPFNAINPRNLWLIVIFIMFINALGQLALRILGERIGLPIVGFISGFISSLATIGAMGTLSKRSPNLMASAAAGAIFSSLATIIELSMILSAVHLPTLIALKWPLLAGAISISLYGFLITYRSFNQHVSQPAKAIEAFSLKSAIVFTGFIAIVLITSAALKSWFGQNGLVLASGLAGLADSHAPTISVATMVASNKLSVQNAVIPILFAFSLNTLSKAITAFYAGGKLFAKQLVPGLIVQVATLWFTWYLV